MTKFLVILTLFLGEVLAILAEVVSAKYFALDGHNFTRIFLKAMPVVITGCILLLFGYMLGLKTFKNIWIVTAVSVTSILIAEPIINYSVTRQLPTKGAFIGLIFGVLGFCATLFL